MFIETNQQADAIRGTRPQAMPVKCEKITPQPSEYMAGRFDWPAGVNGIRGANLDELLGHLSEFGGGRYPMRLASGEWVWREE